jgi:hypothetical protein
MKPMDGVGNIGNCSEMAEDRKQSTEKRPSFFMIGRSNPRVPESGPDGSDRHMGRMRPKKTSSVAGGLMRHEDDCGTVMSCIFPGVTYVSGDRRRACGPSATHLSPAIGKAS